jgi:hypothetical protein
MYLIAERLPYGNEYLALANAKYYLARGRDGQIAALPNQGALGRVSFVTGYTVMDTGRVSEALKAGGYDIRSTVALMEEPEFRPRPVVADSSAPLPSARVTWEKYTPNYRRVVVDAPADGFLRISEVYYPGWEVRIDGASRRVYQADLAWMAVGIEKGKHTVEMMPRSLYLGKASLVSIPAVIALLAYWIFLAVQSLRRRSRSAGTT